MQNDVIQFDNTNNWVKYINFDKLRLRPQIERLSRYSNIFNAGSIAELYMAK